MSAAVELRFYMGRWIVARNGIDVRSFLTSGAANRYAARLRGDVLAR